MTEVLATELFQHEMVRTSGVFGRNQKVQVVFQGAEAATRKDMIILPALPQGEKIKDEDARIMRGYVDHEAGHQRHSDMNFLEKFMERCAKANRQDLKFMANAIEDIWMEKRVIAEYPGAMRNLRAVSSKVNEIFIKEHKKGGDGMDDPRFIGGLGITIEGRRSYDIDNIDAALGLMDPKLVERIKVWTKCIEACQSTQDCVSLAKAICGEIEGGDKVEEDWMPPPPGAETGEPETEAREALGKVPSAGGKPSLEEAKSNEGTVEDKEEENSGAEGGHGSSKGHGHIKDAEFKVPKDFSPSRAVNEVGRTLIQPTNGTVPYIGLPERFDRWLTEKTDVKFRQGRPENYESLMAKTAGQMNVIRRKLERALLAKQNRGWDPGREAGRLDSKRLMAAHLGNMNVFKVREPVTEMDTAVSLLVDLSGSMAGEKAWLATVVALTLTEAIEKAGVKTEVLGFNNRGGGSPELHEFYKEVSRSKSYLSRSEPLNMYEFKAFSHDLRSARPRLANIFNHAGGDNSDADAVLYAFRRLRERKERKRVLIVLSDGQPAASFFDPGDRGRDLELHQRTYLRKVVSLASKEVDVVGIGILDAAVKSYYPKNVLVKSLEDLGETVIEQLARVLISEGYVANNAKLAS